MFSKPRILEISITEELSEVATRFGFGRKSDRAVIWDIECALRRAAADSSVRGLMLKMADAEIGWAKAEAMHRAVRSFRAAGKVTLAYLEGASNAAYACATACEHIILHPSSTLSVHPLEVEAFFFNDLLNELGIEPELEAVGIFKSAGEPLTRRDMSEAHRLQIRELIGDLEQQFTKLIANGRGLSQEAARSAIHGGPYRSDEACARSLVDGADYEDVAWKKLEDQLGAKPHIVSYRRFAAVSWLKRVRAWRRPVIAVVHTNGVIGSGDRRRPPLSARPMVSARAVAETITRLRNTPRVKAVVVRIESPGGAAVASDVIRRELALTQEIKPVIASMGDVAASGGYYIATSADTVLAEEATLTGSIGVVGGKIVLRRLLDRLGIHRETISNGLDAGFFSPTSSFSERQRKWHRESLEHFYRDRFLAAVAEARNLSLDEADAVGQGRVWTGQQAKGRGLVDVIGGLDQAVDIACEKALVRRDKVRVLTYVRRARLSELLRWPMGGTWSHEGPTLDFFLSVLREFGGEEFLLLMPWSLRVR